MEFDERETTTNGGVHHGDGAVSGVHGADDVQVVRQAEGFVGAVLQVNAVITVFKEEVQLAEDLGGLARFISSMIRKYGLCAFSGLAASSASRRNGPATSLKETAVVGFVRTVTLKEILVRV